MSPKVVPIATPDYEASSWLQFTGRRLVDGDPFSTADFRAAYHCLVALTWYCVELGDPWSIVSASDVGEVYRVFCEKQSASQLPGTHFPLFSIANMYALSTRRLRALQEFGGSIRDDYPLLILLHQRIGEAVSTADHERSALPTAGPHTERDGVAAWHVQ